jgi:hypothetical protein
MPSVLKREYPAQQKTKIKNFFLFLLGSFARLDPDPDSGTHLIWIRIRSTAKKDISY